MKSRIGTVTLVYPAFKCGDPSRGKARCTYRLTPKQIVIESGEVIEGHGLALGGLPYRFWRKSGWRAGDSGAFIRTWRLGPDWREECGL